MGIKKGVGGYNQSKQAVDRRELVRKLLEENKELSVPDIQTKLRNEYGIIVTRPTLYSDIASLGSVDSGSLSRLDSKFIDFLESLLRKLDEIVKTCPDERTRITAINAIFKNTKDLYGIIDQIALRNASISRIESEKTGGSGGGGGLTVVFESDVVDVDVKDEDVVKKDEETVGE